MEHGVTGKQLANVLAARIRAGVGDDHRCPLAIRLMSDQQRATIAHWVRDVEIEKTAQNLLYFEALSVPCFRCGAQAGTDCFGDSCKDAERAIGRRLAVA